MKWINYKENKAVEKPYKFIPNGVLKNAFNLHFKDPILEEHYSIMVVDRFVNYFEALSVIVENKPIDYTFEIYFL